MTQEILKKLANIFSNQQKMLVKLANVQPIDGALRQQWIDAIKQECIAAKDMTIFWTDFLKKNRINSRWQQNYDKIIRIANQLQTFTVNTNINTINGGLINLANTIHHENISRDCAMAGWVDLQTNTWHNHVAENAVIIYIEYADDYFIKVKEEQNLNKQVVDNINTSYDIERNNPF